MKSFQLFKLIRQFKGIGSSVSKKLCLLLGLDSRTRANELKKKDLERLDALVREFLIVDKALNFLIKKNISKLKKIKNYTGRRHSLGLPVRGQRTHSNGSTARKLSFFKDAVKDKIKDKFKNKKKR